MTDQEIRVIALLAAASSWAGLSDANRDRDGAILETARRFADYIAGGWR